MEVVKPGLSVEVVASVADGIDAGQGAGGGQDVAPGVIGVSRKDCAVGGDHLLHVALLVRHQEAFRLTGGSLPGVPDHLPIGIIMEVESIVNASVHKQLAAVPDVAPRGIPDRLLCPQPGLVVAEAQGGCSVCHACQLPPALPSHGPAPVGQGIAHTNLRNYFDTTYLRFIVKRIYEHLFRREKAPAQNAQELLHGRFW